ncbi:hypothetical protein R5R35_001225 [Gryllus longicercus]|uniref:Lipase domain-containing protein n=1 Tax=Gryllus longicercus TaxID=2509291 RepID=A0AAN9VFA3_9ORTH
MSPTTPATCWWWTGGPSTGWSTRGWWLAEAFDAFCEASNVTAMAFVGHSLGAHLAGYTARRLAALAVPFLAALDPVGPLFSPVPLRCQEGVRADDAHFVMALHTDAGRFGGDAAVGSANGLLRQQRHPRPATCCRDTS